MTSWISTRSFQVLTLVLSMISGGLGHAQQTTATSSAKAGNSQGLNTLTVKKTEADSNKKFKGTWRIRLEGKRGEDQFNQRSTVDFMIFTNLTYQPVDLFSFNFAPNFRYLNGYAQTQNKTDTNESKFFVRNASADLNAADIFEASVGALDQSYMHHSILLDEIAFPAARMGLSTNKKNDLVVGALAETAIATSSSLSTQTKEAEKTPTFNSAGVFAKAKYSAFEGGLSVQAWQFDNLPMSLATESGLAGNTTRAVTGGTDQVFVYNYKGIEAFGNAKVRFNNRIALGLQGAYVKNDEAPQGLNQGTWSRAFADYHITRNWMITPAYEFFRIEPDAAVAGYNSSYHYTNAVGYRAGLGVEFKRTVRVSVHSGEKDVMFITPSQQRERFWNLKLETLDVAI